MLVILNRPFRVNDSAFILNAAAKLAKKGEGIAFLHIQDACSAIASMKYCDKLLESKINIYALKADAEARGLAKRMNPNVKMIDYKQWVNLLMNEHDKIVSWTS